MDILQEEYISRRLEGQINWYDRMSMSCQSKYKWWKVGEIVAATLIPVLTSLTTNNQWIVIIIGVLGAGIAFVEGLLSLQKYHENWIEYRSVCETLRQEKYMFLTRTGIYSVSETPFQLLVERVESVVSKENVNWANLHSNEQRSQYQKPTNSTQIDLTDP
ncbi:MULTISPECIES: DUF4231 domain-containing protein [Paenibacillus]|uniref:DUF4231 domain-containing protein n=1 Tax=Paenibacillus amylolyticus TaxID=1451 RepID=A0ABD8B0F2_PAEAM